MTPNPAKRQPSLRPVEFQILLVLAERDLHGYGIIRDIEEHTQGESSFEPGTLYRAIRRLVETGFVVESEKRPAPDLDDRRRRYYRLTAAGREAAAREAARLQLLLEKARSGGLIPEES